MIVARIVAVLAWALFGYSARRYLMAQLHEAREERDASRTILALMAYEYEAYSAALTRYQAATNRYHEVEINLLRLYVGWPVGWAALWTWLSHSL